jgi:hypothetical protein
MSPGEFCHPSLFTREIRIHAASRFVISGSTGEVETNLAFCEVEFLFECVFHFLKSTGFFTGAGTLYRIFLNGLTRRLSLAPPSIALGAADIICLLSIPEAKSLSHFRDF